MASKNRSNSAPLSISQLMSGSETGFGRILKRAEALNQLNHRVSRLLDDDLAIHCQVANVRDGRMIFACTSPGSATRLRLQARQLIDQLHAAGLKDIEVIEVRMMVNHPGYR
jgi:hypothetical protein